MLALLVLGVWGLVWMIGFLAATVVHPHLLDHDGIVVRSGAAHRIALPWSPTLSRSESLWKISMFAMP